jgi:transcription elongation factor Elf1
MTETTELQWFRERNFNCRQCGKRGVGSLMGRQNQDYGIHCQSCADKRLKASAKAREEWLKATQNQGFSS